MTPTLTRFREECGTPRGLVLHSIHGEDACGECLHGNYVRELEHERRHIVPERYHPTNRDGARRDGP